MVFRPTVRFSLIMAVPPPVSPAPNSFPAPASPGSHTPRARSGRKGEPPAVTRYGDGYTNLTCPDRGRVRRPRSEAGEIPPRRGALAAFRPGRLVPSVI